MKAALFAWLMSDATLAGLLGEGFYSFPAPPDAAMPYLTLNLLDGSGDPEMNDLIGVCVETWQVDIWARTEASAVAIKAAVEARMATISRQAVGAYWLLWARLEGDRELNELEDGTNERIVRKTLDYAIKRERVKT